MPDLRRREFITSLGGAAVGVASEGTRAENREDATDRGASGQR